MADLARRFENNPIITPEDVKPSLEGLHVECVLNPGAFRHEGRVGLLLRVAESAEAMEGKVRVPVLDPSSSSGIDVLEFSKSDPDLRMADPRVFSYRGRSYLTTLSHLRLAWSDDGEHFEVDEKPTLLGEGRLESFGIEDCRVMKIEDTYYLTYSSVSPLGVGIGMRSTEDWETFKAYGLIFTSDNKDGALFEERINGYYYALNRPGNLIIKGNHIWISRSRDLVYWGDHDCLAPIRPGRWDCERVGAGASPIRTEKGWLEIYHGADNNHRYCLGALLLDLENPNRVLARTAEPIMEPTADYELKGFFGNVIFTNGHTVDGDEVTVYYGASDSVVCGARMSIKEILQTLDS